MTTPWNHRLRLRLLTSSLLAVLASTALAQALPTATPESVGMSSERLQKITSALRQDVADK